jgi:Uma2 family endonuclease
MFAYNNTMKILMRPIEVLVWSEPDGNQRPLRFRLENKDGELVVVHVEQILSQTENGWAGNPMVIYDCQRLIGNRQRRFELKYEKKTCKWWLYRI